MMYVLYVAHVDDARHDGTLAPLSLLLRNGKGGKRWIPMDYYDIHNSSDSKLLFSCQALVNSAKRSWTAAATAVVLASAAG